MIVLINLAYNSFIPEFKMNHRQFSFKNLEPINYLSTFNKMLEYYAKNPPVDFNEKDLKLVALSKFPLPEFYEKMEGIF